MSFHDFVVFRVIFISAECNGIKSRLTNYLGDAREISKYGASED